MKDWTLITGASSGIGLELARVFASHKHNLVLLARNKSKLDELAEDLRQAHGIEVKILPKDLLSADAAREVFDELADLQISILVNNAGAGTYGSFCDQELQPQLDVMQLNMTALVQLTHLFAQPMIQRGGGRILNVASTAAFQPGPTVNTYYATKAFVYSFSYSLAVELEGRGITVTTLCPGTTDTDFFNRAGLPVRKNVPLMSAHAVAEIGYRGLMKGKRVVIPGGANRIGAFFGKRLPERLTTAVVRKLHSR